MAIGKLEVGMAEMKKDISYIKTGLDQNSEEHKDIRREQKGLIKKIDIFIGNVDDKLDSKADKKKVDALYNRFWGLMGAFVLILLSIIGFLLANKFW